MTSVISLLSGLVITLVLGAWGTWYFRNARQRRDEALAGIRALSAMRWREFSHFVLDAMRHRGFEVLTAADQAERGQQTEFLLARDGKRALLSCKHGSAYRISTPAIAEFASSIRLQGARSGILVTPGRIEPAARRPAADAAIELVDGLSLWPEIAPLLPPSLTEDVRRVTEDRARRKVGLAWIGAIVIGVGAGSLLATLLPGLMPRPVAGAASAMVAHPTTATPAADVPAPPRVAAPPAAGQPSRQPAPLDGDAAENAQRREVVQQVGLLRGVSAASWSTRSTLLVEVDASSAERLADICSVLERYELLRTARIQLQPPAGSEQRVRFKQCTTY